jgi:hypothetical protein
VKKYLVISCLLFTAFFCQCKKSKNENKNGPDLKKGLLAYFKMNDVFEDSTGNVGLITSSATGIGPAYDRDHSFSNAFYFDGGKFTFATDNWSVAQLSISVWLYCEDMNNGQYIVLAKPWIFGIKQGGDYVAMAAKTANSGVAYTASGKVIKNEWVHFVGTYDGEKIKAYVNGKFAHVYDFKASLPSPAEISVGSHASNNQHWVGSIDDLRFYNRILTEEEIAILANQ